MTTSWKRAQTLADQIRQAYKAGDVERARELEAELDVVAYESRQPGSTLPSRPAWRSVADLWPLAALAGVATLAVLVLNRCAGSGAPRVPAAAITACQNAILDRAHHPSTVSFDILGLTTFVSKKDGSYEVQQSFSAKNSFGVDLRFVGFCLFPPHGQVTNPEVLITEARR